MTIAPNYQNELYELAGAQCEGTMTADQAVRLEELVLGDGQLRRRYILYMHVHACAEQGLGHLAVSGKLMDSECGMRDHTLSDPRIPSLESQASNLPFPIFSPLPTISSSNFVGGPVFSYMVATVILCMMLLGAWAYNITRSQSEFVDAPSVPSYAAPELVFVGRITGMVDCTWSDPSTEPFASAYVPLGRKYAMVSGLMKITYDTGAQVILEGPCAYEVDSSAGGYLSLGKLTAKVEKDKSEVRGRKSEHYPLSPLPPPLFSVRTPTAVITDLGTEFGVEVSEEGSTMSYVFRGSVKVHVVSEGRKTDVVLRANESVWVEEKSKGADGPRLVLSKGIVVLPKFVRRIFELPKQLDLLDIVAGGNGLGRRRERGIDPVTGMEDPLFVPEHRGGDHQYWPVGWHTMIDGVFVPNGESGPVKINSAGHVFDGFPDTAGDAFGSIWSRAAKVRPYDNAFDRSYKQWIYAMGHGEKFMPQGRGLLALHSNSGITFDLRAMRRAFPGTVPSRFNAVAGMADAGRLSGIADGMVDFWVFIDGRPMLKRTRVRPKDGTFQVDVEIKPDDRFLTLAVTDGGNTTDSDWSVFGDPVLRMTETTLEDHKEDRPMEH